MPVDYMGSIKTQAAAPAMAACIGQAVAVTPAASQEGLVVDAPNIQPPRRYTVVQTKVQTVVTIQGPYTPGVASSDAMAVRCATVDR